MPAPVADADVATLGDAAATEVAAAAGRARATVRATSRVARRASDMERAAFLTREI
jgi:hypothetical protein